MSSCSSDCEIQSFDKKKYPEKALITCEWQHGDLLVYEGDPPEGELEGHVRPRLVDGAEVMHGALRDRLVDLPDVRHEVLQVDLRDLDQHERCYKHNYLRRISSKKYIRPEVMHVIVIRNG